MKEKRIIRTTTNIKNDGSYSCSDCDKDLKIEDIDMTNWRSKCCGSDIVIYSKIMEKYIIRKMANMVQKGDDVIDYRQRDLIEVLGVSTLKDGYVMIGLKETGGQIVPKNDIVDVLF